MTAISVVMPCHNGRIHLPRSIGSIQSQTFTDWELIVVDDGSSDGSADWVSGLADDRIRCIRQANAGVSAARNAGLAKARGEYIAFLDADDSWSPAFLDRMHDLLRISPQAVLAYCGWQNVGLDGDRGKPFIPPDYETPDKEAVLFAGCRWPIHAVLARRKAIEAAGGFDPRLRNAEDYALWLDVAAKAPIVRLPEVMAQYYFHSSTQASSQHARAALSFASAQLDYLARHPDFAAALGRHRRRELVWGALLRKGNECHWKRELTEARQIYRAVMLAGYGQPADWIRMLPSVLPLSLHRRIVGQVTSGAASS